MYEYKAIVKRVIDGDTIVVDLDLGRHIWVRDAKHRLNGLNCWESNTEAGQEATKIVRNALPPGTEVVLQSFKPYKYGDEYMCDILMGMGQQSLCQWMIDHQWAAPWDGKGTPPLPPWPREV